MQTVFDAQNALHVLWHRLGRLHAQRSLLEIVLAETGDAMVVVPNGSGEWTSPAKEAYLAALGELRSGMTVVAEQAQLALTEVLRQLDETAEEERVARIALADAEVGAGVGAGADALTGGSVFVTGGSDER